MSDRAKVDTDLDRLEAMLPHWRESLRHEMQFWPQFKVLSGRILEGLDEADSRYVRERLDRMLAKHGLRHD